MSEWNSEIEMWTALSIGYNEMVKAHDDKAQKIRLRMLRDHCEREAVKLGGKRFWVREDPMGVL